jgi:ABC-type dipeptide/oligopeptide/nickel transport system permease component
MKSDLLERLLVAIPSLRIASLVAFTLPHLLPGAAVQLMLEEKVYGKDLGVGATRPGARARRARRILVG